MKISQGTLMAVTLFATGLFGATNSRADTIYIPYSSALQGNQGLDDPINSCKANLADDGPYRFTNWGINFDCVVDFPLTVPVGRTIQQISVVHGLDFLTYAFDKIEAKLVVMSYQPPQQINTTMFDWVSTSNTIIDTHPMMAQFGKLYPDQFQVLANTAYQVEVTLSPGAQVSAIVVTYN